MTKYMAVALVVVILMFGATVRRAEALAIVFNNGTLQDSTSVTETILATEMSGVLQLTAMFLGGSTETVSWGNWATPPSGTVGSIFSPGSTLIGNGNTFSMLWRYQQNSAAAITSLSLSGGNLAFDRGSSTPVGYSFSGVGTPGSSGGFGFQVDTTQDFGDGFADDPAGWVATFSNAVTLNGAAAVGDLYKTLTINFGTAGFTGNFNFNMDVDSYVPAAGDPPGGGGTPVPEPASVVLFGSALLGLAAGRKAVA